MAMTNAEKQAALRARRTRAGLVLFQAWVTPEQAARLKAVIDNQAQTATAPQSTATAMNGPAPTGSAVAPRRRRRKEDPVTANNRSLILQHQAEIFARLRAGEKPTALAAWLQQFGFVGSGATFNGFWREL